MGEADVERLRAEVTHLRLVLERKNRELDALHLVWCSGSCPSGVHRWTDEKVTGDLVETAERNYRPSAQVVRRREMEAGALQVRGHD